MKLHQFLPPSLHTSSPFDSHGARRTLENQGGRDSACACSMFRLVLKRIARMLTEAGLLSLHHHFWYAFLASKRLKIVCLYVCVWHRFFDYDLSVCIFVLLPLLPLPHPCSSSSSYLSSIFFVIRCSINHHAFINFIFVFHIVSMYVHTAPLKGHRTVWFGKIKRVNKRVVILKNDEFKVRFIFV